MQNTQGQQHGGKTNKDSQPLFIFSEEFMHLSISSQQLPWF
jgi:hypothetical protein